jgi:hypothetical protein
MHPAAWINEGGMMRIKWKYPVSLGGLLMAFAATAVSCSKDSTSPGPAPVLREDPYLSQQKMQDLQDKYGWTGRYHTEALAHVYSTLSRGKSVSSRSEKCRTAVSALKEFNKSFSKDGKSKGIPDDFLSDGLCNGTGLPPVSQPPANLTTSSTLSPKAVAMLQQIQNLFDSGASASAIVSSINAIENAAGGTLSAAEAGAVVSLGAVAISSAQYWDANLANWRSVTSSAGAAFNQQPTSIRPSATLLHPTPGTPGYSMASGTSIGKADAAAFLSSLIAGWWMGALDIETSAVRAAIASMLAAF